jgi:hypothetical protein
MPGDAAVLRCAVLLCGMQMLSKVMDNAVTIPLINKKIGLDAMIGLVPYAGVPQQQPGCVRM